ncbi:MAG: class I lanthipeptide [Hyphomicrobiales bacterium]
MKSKLKLKKEVIANLENFEMKALNGGFLKTVDCLKTTACRTADCGCSKSICPDVITYSCVESMYPECIIR